MNGQYWYFKILKINTNEQPLLNQSNAMIPNIFTFHFYADDTQLYKSVDACEVPSLFESLQKCVCDVSKWMNANKLQLNHDKTEVIVIGTPAKVSAIKTRSVELCGELINITSSVRNLGAHLDSNLSMNQHILQLRKTCYLELRRIAQIQQYLTVESANRIHEVSIAVAKLIPVVNSQLSRIVGDAPNQFIQELLLMEELKQLAANVYEAFSQDPSEIPTI
ncbi:peroxisomal biogenesis factor 3 [Elysia marginata]|uniref:Peroxisomal biogenesis factor 3 n=1 Tax=Elysia marginata TaxID=1093978 RepID=A0AAV4J2W7_9GAST|nr:peroxisomal biogenesis factor 3 [Elysia marginata]